MDIILMLFLSTLTPVLAKIECYDSHGKPVSNGDEFHPKKEDPCLVCRCDMGSPTMCKSVKCGPPSCKKYEILPDRCCDFKCIYTGAEKPGANSTGSPPFNTDVSGSPTDSTMTDLGLRLVASTVTTFLILFLLLFLIHRLRQRRLLMTLRRYSRRREHLEDSDDISYTPDFYGIQCPPYFDPPPPYSPPKPPHIQHGELPPPYEEAIDNNGNNPQDLPSCFNSQQNQSLLTNNQGHQSAGFNDTSARVSAPSGADCNQMMPGHCVGQRTLEVAFQNGLVQSANDNTNVGPQSLMGNGCVSSGNNSSSINQNRQDRNSSVSVHFRNSTIGQPTITMGVQNRGRHNRNRFSDGCFNLGANRGAQPGRARLLHEHTGLNLELKNALHNYRNDIRSQQAIELQRHSLAHVGGGGEQSSSTTDIGESSTSAESLESSPNVTPESPENETQVLKVCSHNSLENLTEDADSTVRQFLDRQFGPMSKVRRYPTTLSQSWTSALHSSAMPNFRQSLSLGSFLLGEGESPSTSEERSVLQSTDLTTAPRASGERHMLRSKSDQLKTNGSLRSPPYKGVVRSQTVTVPQTMSGCSAARVSYVESDEIRTGDRHMSASDNQSVSSVDNCTVDINVSENSSPDVNTSRKTGSKPDPGDIIVTRRQDVLRELRLSHLLHNPSHNGIGNCEIPLSPGVVHGLSNRQSSGAMFNSMSESASTSENEVIIGNDAQYPESSRSPGKSVASKSSASDGRRSAGKSSIKMRSAGSANGGGHSQNRSNAQEIDSLNSSDESKVSNSNSSSPAHRVLMAGTMSQSWHGNGVDSSDENSTSWSSRTDTLGRNVNTNLEKKTFTDKNVSNLFYPVYKHSGHDGVSAGNRNSVPNSNMRACASQMYNCETEDRASRKDKKKHFLKRHSAGCFPVKRDAVSSHSLVPQLGPKLSQKLKNSHRLNSHQRMSDTVLESSRRPRRVSSRDKKTGQLLHHDKCRQHNDSSHVVPVTDLTPSCLMHSGLASSSVVESQKGALKSFEYPDAHSSRKNRSSSSKSDRRSKSLSRNESSHSKDVEKHSDFSTSQRTHGRRKKAQNPSLIHGTASFHDELEHVVEHQQRALNLLRSPTTKSANKSLGSDGHPRAISHV